MSPTASSSAAAGKHILYLDKSQAAVATISETPTEIVLRLDVPEQQTRRQRRHLARWFTTIAVAHIADKRPLVMFQFKGGRLSTLGGVHNGLAYMRHIAR